VLLQFGAFGALLWIVFALAPKHLKEAADERKLAMEATAKERQDRDRRFNKLMVMMHKKFDARNDKIVAAVKEQTKELIQEMGQSCRFHGDCDNFRPRHETMLQPHSTQQEKDK
jgi:F0F1-type ATP synthase membrane subunit b/b'